MKKNKIVFNYHPPTLQIITRMLKKVLYVYLLLYEKIFRIAKHVLANVVYL